MSRRQAPTRRKLLEDPMYGSTLFTKFINQLMVNGKKSCAQNIVYSAIQKVAQRVKSDNPAELLEKALNTLKPPVEVKSRRVGGATYQIPVEVHPIRAITLAIRWLIEAARKRSEKGMINRLAAEIQEVLENRGNAIKKREDVLRMAEANKAFAHYRW